MYHITNLANLRVLKIITIEICKHNHRLVRNQPYDGLILSKSAAILCVPCQKERLEINHMMD